MLIGHGAAVAVGDGAAAVASDGVDDDGCGERYCYSVAQSAQQRLCVQTPFGKKASAIHQSLLKFAQERPEKKHSISYN